jgi:hypothetical protein
MYAPRIARLCKAEPAKSCHRVTTHQTGLCVVHQYQARTAEKKDYEKSMSELTKTVNKLREEKKTQPKTLPKPSPAMKPLTMPLPKPLPKKETTLNITVIPIQMTAPTSTPQTGKITDTTPKTKYEIIVEKTTAEPRVCESFVKEIRKELSESTKENLIILDNDLWVQQCSKIIWKKRQISGPSELHPDVIDFEMMSKTYGENVLQIMIDIYSEDVGKLYLRLKDAFEYVEEYIGKEIMKTAALEETPPSGSDRGSSLPAPTRPPPSIPTKQEKTPFTNKPTNNTTTEFSDIYI